MYLASVGQVEGALLDAVGRRIGAAFGLETRRIQPLPEPDYAWDAARRQYSSVLILRDLAGRVPRDAARLLALTERDLFIPMLSFIYGQAQWGGPVALVSLARLRQEFYGLAPDTAIVPARAAKEALHEMGHTFRLVHCPERACVMSLATNIQQLDQKGGGFCEDCAVRLPVPRIPGGIR